MTWKRRLACPTCGATFSTLEEVAAHDQTTHQPHNQPRAGWLMHDFSCPWCGAEFASPEELEVHNHRAHLPRPWRALAWRGRADAVASLPARRLKGEIRRGDCADTCVSCTNIMSRDSEYAGQVCGVCADLCDACAEECEKGRADIMRQCAEACRRAAKLCRQMAA
jgi:uncharacterized C2H2 Zn-finger protein